MFMIVTPTSMLKTDSLTSMLCFFFFFLVFFFVYDKYESTRSYCCHIVDGFQSYIFFESAVDSFRNLNKHRRPCPISTQSTRLLTLQISAAKLSCLFLFCTATGKSLLSPNTGVQRVVSMSYSQVYRIQMNIMLTQYDMSYLKIIA